MKRLLSISLFLFLMYFCYSQNHTALTNNIVIRENSDIHKLFIHNDGRPYVKGTVMINNSVKADCFFLLDTCYPKSILVNYRTNRPINDLFVYSENKNANCLICDCDFNSFSVEDWTLEYEWNDNFDFSEISDNYIAGIIGTDILMKESFYISLTKEEFGWANDFKFDENEKIQSYKLIEQKQKGLSPIYQIEIEDDSFKSDYTFSQFLSKDGEKSKYNIDTGSHFIFTSDMKDFYSITGRKKYQNFVFRNYIDSIGICLAENARLFDKDFKNIQFNGGRFGSGSLKVLGCQILSAFDLYFIKGKDGIITTLKLIPVAEEDYCLYRKQYDRKIQYSIETFGFLTDYSKEGGVVRYKAYVNNEKDLLPELEIGDMILLIDKKNFSSKLLQESHGKITLKIQKRNGKIRELKVRKYSLGEIK